MSTRTSKHGERTTTVTTCYKQLIICAQMISITAAYFDAPLVQGEGQGAEKWQRQSFFQLTVNLTAAEACKVLLQREDCHISIIGEFVTCTWMKCCKQGRHTA